MAQCIVSNRLGGRRIRLAGVRAAHDDACRTYQTDGDDNERHRGPGIEADVADLETRQDHVVDQHFHAERREHRCYGEHRRATNGDQEVASVKTDHRQHQALCANKAIRRRVSR